MKQAELRSRSGLKGGHRLSLVGLRMEHGARLRGLPMTRTSRSDPIIPAWATHVLSSVTSATTGFACRSSQLAAYAPGSKLVT